VTGIVNSNPISSAPEIPRDEPWIDAFCVLVTWIDSECGVYGMRSCAPAPQAVVPQSRVPAPQPQPTVPQPQPVAPQPAVPQPRPVVPQPRPAVAQPVLPEPPAPSPAEAPPATTASITPEPVQPLPATPRLILRYAEDQPAAKAQAEGLAEAYRSKGYEVVTTGAGRGALSETRVTYYYAGDRGSAESIAAGLAAPSPERRPFAKDDSLPRPGTVEVSIAR